MIEVIRFLKPFFADPNSEDFLDTLNEQCRTTRNPTEELAPGKYDMTPDIAKQLKLPTNTLRVRADGTGIFIITSDTTHSTMQTYYRGGTSKTQVGLRQIVQLPRDTRDVVVATPDISHLMNPDQVQHPIKNSGRRGKLIFSAVKYTT